MRGLFVLLVLMASLAEAQPAPVSTAGALTQGSAVTISGTSFSTRGAPTKEVYDNAEGTNPLTLWDAYEPTACSASGSDDVLDYRTPIRSTALPYTINGNTQYLVGMHCDDNFGNLYVQSNYTRPSLPYYSVWSYYGRMDPAWNNTGGENADANNKIYQISTGTVVFSTYWYLEYGGFGRPINSSTNPSAISLDVHDSGGFGGSPFCVSMVGGENGTACSSSGPGSPAWGNNGVPNPINGWLLHEIELKWANDGTGYVKVWMDGVARMHMIGNTDGEGAGARNEAIGLYARAREPNSFRYMDAIHFVTGADARARVRLCPGSTFAARGACSSLPVTAWSSTSIGVTWLANQIPTGTAYLYVTDKDGNTNSNGLPVTNGGDSPVGPTRIRVKPGAL
jgi:hypothetical protein